MRRRIHVVALMLLICLSVSLVPCRAYARSLEVNGVDIDAVLGTDGSLGVVEQRTYDFSGEYNGIYWDVHEGAYEGREVRARVTWVGAISSGNQTLLEEGYDGAPGTYELTDMGDYQRLKIYWPAQDETVTFQVAYTVTGITSRWADVGELYWQYVPADPDSEGEWKNVSCTVHVPVPDGTTVVPGETVRAWGHGPLDGTVDIANDAVRYYSPGVGSMEYLEARIAFPGEWLTGIHANGEMRLDTILAEEDQWAKDANASRWKARFTVFGIPALMCLSGLGSVIAFFVHRRMKKVRAPKAQFTDTYFRDVPTNDHPAVLGMLYRDGTIEGKDFSATLMRLVDEGRATMDTVEVPKRGKHGGASGKRKREWHMILRKDAPAPGRLFETRAGGKKIDDAAFDFLFNVVADKHKHTIDPALLGPAGEPYVIASFFDETAEDWPGAYRGGYNAWKDAVEAAYRKRAFVVKKEDDLFSGLLMIGDFALAVVLGVVCMFVGVPNLLACVAIVVQFGCGIALALMSNDEDETAVVYSQEAMEIQARLEALKRWLRDFTRLEEAIPTDVVLWNRLLVMATVLDVAEEVVKQLKVYAPGLVSNPSFVASGWYEDDLEKEFFVPTVAAPRSETPSSGSYHSTSSYSTASSRDSSSSGRGGGFSSGGGGGFSGGGGRGGGF